MAAKTAAKKTAAKAAPPAKAPAKAQAPVVVARTGDVKEIPFTEGMTISEALKKAGYTFNEAEEIRLNNAKTTNGQAALKPGDQLLIVGRIRGA